MKIKLTPEISYLIGLWRKTRCSEGLGVKGDSSILSVFSKTILDLNISVPEKILSSDDRVYLYHTAYRKFFQEIEQEQLERFKYLNEYAASYLAGMFDGAGSIDERGIVSIGHTSKQDDMMLLRLGFVTKRRGSALVLDRPVLFLTFIKNYVKIFKDHKVFSYIRSDGASNKS